MNVQQIIKTLDIFRLKIMALALQQCEREPDEKILKLFPNMYLNESVYRTMRKILPKFEETIFQCKFSDKWRNCSEIMFQSLTDKGLCYSFNRISLPEYLTDEYVKRYKLYIKRPNIYFIYFDLGNLLIFLK